MKGVRVRWIIFPLALWAVMGFISCSSGASDRKKTAILWTDRPEFALYSEYFNAVQNQYKIEVYYYDYPGQRLQDNGVSNSRGSGSNGAARSTGTGKMPDIVAGSWLRGVSTRTFLKPLNRHLKSKGLRQEDFYSRLLALGNIDGKQYLLPVSFNAPVVIFARDKGEKLSNPFTIGFSEMKELGKDYNAETHGVYTRMGFSPTWDDNFLFIISTLFNVSFREGDPLAWDSLALDRAMNFVCEWVCEANTSIQAVEDFTFKYFYEPPATLALSGRILFTCMNSSNFFTLAEEQRNNLDFRWLAERNSIPLVEGSIYFGLAKKGKAPKAAEAFLRWFFNADTQRSLLEKSHQNRIFETSFGIAGGFSAMRPVTEQAFPQFYHTLLGHMPPEDFLSPDNILPVNWMTMKERVILPYLHDRGRQPGNEEVYRLERRLADWQRLSR